MNILLMGLRGCGKTTIGRLLAEAEALVFVDLDERVLDTFSEPSVSEVWANRGEAAWRAAESRVLEEIMRQDGQVVALGGGTPMIDTARRVIEDEQLGGGAVVIYLRCTVDELTRRLARDTGDRPSLTGRDPVHEIADVLGEREPTFRGLADLEHDVTDASPEQIVHALSRQLGGGG